MNKNSSNLPEKKNTMSSGNFARSLGVAKGIGRATSFRGSIPKNNMDDDKPSVTRHMEHR